MTVKASFAVRTVPVVCWLTVLLQYDVITGMYVHTAKTTLVFTPGFLRTLKRIAREQRKSMSRLVEDELNPVFQNREKRKLSKMLATMRKWQGSGSPGITDASKTIDETLYGAGSV